jgi:hypothetical protein
MYHDTLRLPSKPLRRAFDQQRDSTTVSVTSGYDVDALMKKRVRARKHALLVAGIFLLVYRI